MRIFATHKDGSKSILEFVGPLKVISHPSGMMDLIHDEATGNDYWFDKIHGYFDGAGCSVRADNLTSEEARALLKGLQEMQEGKTRPLSEIRDELKNREN